MKYLLIDFGASLIKYTVFNSIDNTFEEQKSIPSLLINDTVTKKEVFFTLQEILSQHTNITKVFTCSILGGYYYNDTYISWKESKNRPPVPTSPKCLIGGLFSDSSIHTHHAESLGVNGNDKIQILAYIKNLNEIELVPIYTNLGDTNCVIKSINLSDKELLINMGTGSQVVDKTGILQSFIPSGRVLSVFNNFFADTKINMFNFLGDLNVKDIIESDLEIDLNIFPQCYQYSGGGHIKNLNNNNFTIKNFVSSLIRCYCSQYFSFINRFKPQVVNLTGGIPKKNKCIVEYFRFYFPKTYFNVCSNNVEQTLIGLSKYTHERID